MALKGGGKNHTPTKQPKYSSMTYKQSEDVLFWMSNLEQQVEFEKMMENMEKNMQGEL